MTQPAKPRRVILLCGPPGSGKTTRARQLAAELDLTVYDLDDPRWRSERAFNDALRRIGRDAKARAVVIRAGATHSARARAAEMVRASSVEMLAVDAETCRKRVVARKQGSARTEIAAIKSWWASYEPGEVPVFLTARPYMTARPSDFSPRRSKSRKRGSQERLRKSYGPGSTTKRGYGARHQALRKQWAPAVASGRVKCARCGFLIAAGESWDLGHVDGDKTRYQGPEHSDCNRSTNSKTPRRRQSRRW